MSPAKSIQTVPIGREDRIKAVSDHISKVAGVMKSMATPDKPVRFDSRTGSLEFTPDEVEDVRAALLDGDASSVDISALLLAETLALRLKISEDFKDFETASGLDAELEEIVAASLRQDLALAESLAGDFRLIIDQLYVDDDREAAVRLGEFRMAVRQDMARIRQQFPHEGGALDESLDEAAGRISVFASSTDAAESFDLEEIFAGLAEEAEAAEAPVDPVAAAQKRLEELRERKLKAEKERRQKKRIRRMFFVLGVVTAIAAVQLILAVVPAFQAHDTVILTESDFARITVIIKVEATPPSLLAVVNGKRWRKMKPHQHHEIVGLVGWTVDRAGYNSAHLRDENGVLVGEWIRGVGMFIPEP
jgi:hypothetical protein